MTDVSKWSAMGNCVYAGDDAGQLVAECSSRAVAEALVDFANGFCELRRQIAKSLNAREDAREHG